MRKGSRLGKEGKTAPHKQQLRRGSAVYEYDPAWRDEISGLYLYTLYSTVNIYVYIL